MMAGDEEDYATELATIQCRIADIQELLDAQEPVQSEDSRVALEVYLEELQNEAVSIQDRQISKRVVVFQEAEEEEYLRGNDEDNEPDPEEQLFERFTELNVAAPTSIDAADLNNDINNNIIKVKKPSHPFARTNETCTLCLDEKLFLMRVVTAPCGHAFCNGCVRELFDKCLRDETMFPPRCCECEEPISPEEVPIIFGAEKIRRYHEKEIEFRTPHAKRVYCSAGECSAFIPVEHINPAAEEAHCEHCWAATCTICKASAHDGECPDDSVLKGLLEIGDKMGWKRCEKCHAMIQKTYGCVHISCRCGYEFCYKCSAEWQTCDCELWANDEELLEGEARALADIMAEDQRITEGAREEVAAHLLCDRELRWERLDGHHVCHVCWEVMPHFVLMCGQCGLQACHQCRYHRV